MKYFIPFEKDAKEITQDMISKGVSFSCNKIENGWEFEVDFGEEESSGSPMVRNEAVMGIEITIPVSMDSKWKQKTPFDQLTAIRDSMEGELSNFDDGITIQAIFLSRMWNKMTEISMLEPFLKNPKKWKVK